MTRMETTMCLMVVPNVLSPRDLVFRPDIGRKLYHHHKQESGFLMTWLISYLHFVVARLLMME